MEVPTYSPREIVSELDRFIVGQNDAKRAVAIAMRNRWRRQNLPEAMREEVVPKNILMIGPTGCGKTEIARRLARLAQAPFLKVEATKFTEVGYVGRDVDSIARDLVEASLNMLRDASRKEVQAKAELAAEERLITALVGEGAAADTRSKFRRMLRNGEFEQKEIEVSVSEPQGMPIGQLDMPGMPPGQVINLGEMMKGMFGRQPQKRRITVKPPASCWRPRKPTACSTTTRWRRTRWRMPRTTASCSSTRSTRSAPGRRKAVSAAATCRVRACSATCCR